MKRTKAHAFCIVYVSLLVRAAKKLGTWSLGTFNVRLLRLFSYIWIAPDTERQARDNRETSGIKNSLKNIQLLRLTKQKST